MAETADFLVVGGGVIGLAIARELKRRSSQARVVVVDKEAALGRHASGRNSGVIHAGFYYRPGSLKARLTAEGNRALTAFIEQSGLPINKCGKLVVANTPDEAASLLVLAERAAANGATVEVLTETEAATVEPRARAAHGALFSPATATADPELVLEALAADAVSNGVEVMLETPFVGGTPDRVETGKGVFSCGHLINAAGLGADRVAHLLGAGSDYVIVPFKGLYLLGSEPAGAFRTNVYPVPDLRYPFLGVHVTVGVDGRAKLGPTAIPAFWNEQYGGWAGFRAREFLRTVGRDLALTIRSDFDFKRLAARELAKYRKARLVELAGRLVSGLRREDYGRWGRPGIRAQLMDRRTRQLVMDFVVEKGERSTHILNAVSPGWTCSMPFASLVVDWILGDRDAT